MIGRGLLRTAVAALLLGLAGAATAQGPTDGARDPDFGVHGERLLPRPFSSHDNQVALGDVAVRADRRIGWTLVDGLGDVVVGRLLPGGQPDPAFGDQGLVRLDDCVASPPRRLQMAWSDEGGVVVWTGACLRRLREDGSLDADFAVAATMPAADFVAADLQRDDGGRWLLAGHAGSQAAVWRFLPDGDNDAVFGNGGVATPTLPPAQQRQVHALQQRPDGRLLLGGWSERNFRTGLLLVQLDAQGALDPTFGVGGVVEQLPPDGVSVINIEAMALDRRGRVRVAGDGRSSLQFCCVLHARFEADGTLDAGYGLRLLPAPPSTTLSDLGESNTALAMLPGDRMLLARNAFPFPGPENTRTRFTLIRIRDDGEPDAGFGEAGWRTYFVVDPSGAGLGGPYSQFHALAVADAAALMFGRTFFEDGGSTGQDYASFIRVTFEQLFADAFEP